MNLKQDFFTVYSVVLTKKSSQNLFYVEVSLKAFYGISPKILSSIPLRVALTDCEVLMFVPISVTCNIFICSNIGPPRSKKLWSRVVR